MRFLCLALLATMLVGCSGSDRPLSRVTGKVTLDGKPIADAVVTFVSTSGGVACSGSTDSKGEYIIGCQFGAGAPPGVYKVQIKSREVATKSSNPMEGLTPGSPEYQEAYKKMMASGRTAVATPTKARIRFLRSTIQGTS